MAQFIRRHPDQDCLLNILDGAVRSSKTFGVNAKFISHMAAGWWPGGTGLITGKSKTSIKINILNDVFATVGKRHYHYNSSNGELQLFKRPFLVIGAADESRHTVIKGMTCGLWIGDQAELYPKSFIDMAMSRLSLPGSRAYWTTNPADPYHHIKIDWIDNPKTNQDWFDEDGVFHKQMVWTERYTLFDNPNITELKKEQIRRMFTGIFYKRNVEGIWCIADGAVYRDVISDDTWYTNSTRPLGLKSRGGHREHWVLVDFGTINPCVFIDHYDTGDVVYWDREYYFDSRVRMLQKTDAEYADDMLVFVNGGDPLNPLDRLKAQTNPSDSREWPGIIVDPSAASLKLELRKRGFYVIDADNEVMEGISMTATMLQRKKLKINKEQCPHGVQEMQSYAWDEKRAENGKEQPVKSHDHYPDAGRYGIKTRVSPYRLAA